jgi:hypothetical protein
MFNEQAGGCVAKRVKVIARFPVLGHSAFDLKRPPDASEKVRVGADGPSRSGENQFAAGGAGDLPLPKRIKHERRKGNVPRASGALRRPDAPPRVGALRYVNNTLRKVNITPAEAAQFACPHAGEDGCDNIWTPALRRAVDQDF